MSTAGVISGTVTSGKHATATGPYSFTVTVTDMNKPIKNTATATFVLNVNG